MDIDIQREVVKTLHIHYQHEFPLQREQVWDHLQNEDVLRKSLPGCRKFERVSEDTYDAELGLNIGPVKGTFTGQVRLSDQTRPESYRLVLKGKGKPGELNADARITLEENSGETVVSCAADVQVTGVLASVGQRVMGSVAKLILGQFFKAVASQIRQSA
ncbi:CoxG family protein [Novibacillus thermophilus]|uniref:CoxG family protein n=1 Tax=Novibacillus thermophilus TaxID=1471761 RepID=UPI001473C819|nr:carbon monoxide dehydrogenase subunit G [Novibacillus thermophilus]